jgi:anaerobic magnesium-protoporphyrin IX monomethyl ester cyclase
MAEKLSLKPKISFIIPKVKVNPFSMLNSLPVGPLILATTLKKKGYLVKVFNEERNPILICGGRIMEPDIISSDIICVSIMTSNAERGYFFSDKLREMGKKVIIGGMHASVMPEEAALHADCVVKGEGDNVIKKVEEITGIVEAGVVEDVNGVEIPEISLGAGNRSIIDRFYGISIPVSTIRGCPFNCDFCSVSNVYGKKARRMTPERTGQEIERRMAERRKPRRKYLRFFYCDDTYSLYKNERKEQHRIIRKLEKKYGQLVSLCVQDRADRLYNDGAYVKDMSGLVKRVMLGIEQMDDKFLKAHNKGIEIGQIKETVKLLHKNGIGIHAFCMVGPDTTEETINKTVSYLLKSGIQTAQFTMLTPLPGTELYEKTSNLLVKGWENYNTLASVFKEKQGAFTKKTAGMYAKFYSIKKILSHAFRLEPSYFISSLYGKYIGMKIFAARKAPVKNLPADY